MSNHGMVVAAARNGLLLFMQLELWSAGLSSSSLMESISRLWKTGSFGQSEIIDRGLSRVDFYLCLPVGNNRIPAGVQKAGFI